MKTNSKTWTINGLAILLAIILAGQTFAQPGGGGGDGGGGGMGPGGGMGGQSFGGDSSSRSSQNSTSYGGSQSGEAVIQYYAETGQLIVIADDDTNQQIAQIIEKLDQPVPQVLIKVLFLEVTHTDSLDLGAEGTFSWGPADQLDSISTNFGVGAETMGGFYRVLSDDLEVTLRALAQNTKTEVLSRPSVLARNNEEAVITVGQEVPFIRDSRITDNGDTINTIEYEDIGIILTVTPFVTAGNLVEMYVNPEISALTAETVPISETVDATVISKRSAETRAIVASGKTIVIGGMMEDQDTEAIDKIPLLGDIPLLGALFRHKVTNKTKTELLIFLTPYIVENQDQLHARSISEHGQAEIAPKAFSQKQLNKYIDNLKPEETEQAPKE